MRAQSLRVTVAVGVVSAFLLAPSVAGAAEVSWQRRIAGRADGVAVDARGNVFVAASTDWTGEPPTSVFARFGPGGRLAWVRRWDPAGAWTNAVDVATGPDGSVFLAGNVHLDGYEGGAWFLERFSRDGRLLWRRAPNWRTPQAVGVNSVAVGAGMVVIGGLAYGCCSEAADEGFVRAYSLDGELLWHHDVQGPGRLAAFHDGVGDVAVGATGRIYLAGWSERRARSDVGERVDVDVLIQKLSSDGHEIWTRVLADHGRRDTDHGVGVSARGDELVVAAFMGGGPLENRRDRAGHGWLGRFAFDGTLRWARRFGTRAATAARPEAVTIADDGRILVVGSRRDPGDGGLDAFVRAYAPTGHHGWDEVLGTARTLWATVVDAAGGVLGVSGIRFVRQEPTGGLVWRLRLR